MTTPTISLVPQVVAHVVRLRKIRKWTAQRLADEITSSGGDLTRLVIANLENDRRETISIDELAALGAAFGVDPWDLTQPEPVRCPRCDDGPPDGFTCNLCGLTAEVQG